MIGVIHLVWAPLGYEPLREFLRSYHAHSAGQEHELIVVLNGAGEGGPIGLDVRELLLRELDDSSHRLIVLDEPVQDLAAYGKAARLCEHEQLCFMNSYCVIEADGWLGYLSRALSVPDVGLVGTTASWESQAEWLRGKVRYWPYQLAKLPGSRRDFPRFPNPHIRTSLFMLDREIALGMDLEGARDKRLAYLLESGTQSITRQVQELGLRAVVVGLDGQIYDVEDWPNSGTFRYRDQQNLLVSDNQTRDYVAATRRRRCRVGRDSWGERYRAADS